MVQRIRTPVIAGIHDDGNKHRFHVKSVLKYENPFQSSLKWPYVCTELISETPWQDLPLP